MARTFVINPQTGRPAVAITNFQDIERQALEQPLSDLNKEIGDLNNQIGELQRQRDEKTAQATDLKSEIEGFDAVANGTGVETGAEGASSQTEAFAAA
jgi:peptidoglycan hydrolase CwlO-like protein